MEMESGKLFIGGISWDTSEERLREYFETFGEVVEAVIMKDRTTGRARGFGFVVFANASVAEKVVKQRHTIDGRTVEAKKAVPRDDHQNMSRSSGSIQGSPSPVRTKKIFVGGLASSVTEIDFKEYFNQFGTTTDAVVMYDHNTQRPRGFGFVTFDSEEAVDKVLFKTFHELNGKMVEVKRAVPKDLSPAPTRSPSASFNSHGPNRMSSLLNAYGHPGYTSTSPGRFSPANVGRSGYPPYSPSNYGLGLSLDSGLGFNHADTLLEREISSVYGLNSGRYCNNPIGYDLGSVPSMHAAGNRNLWSTSGINYGTNTVNPNAFGEPGTGNSYGNIGEIWGSAQTRGNVGFSRNNGGPIGPTSSYAVTSNDRNGPTSNLLRGESLYHFDTWPAEFQGSGPFDYERGGAADVAPNKSTGYIGGYSVNARSTRGIAA